MTGELHHRVEVERAEPGELSFLARIGGHEQRVWLRSKGQTAGDGNATVAACLLPAMASGGTLEIDAPVSPRVMRNQREFQAVQRAWSLGWEFLDEHLSEVELIAPEGKVEQPDRTGNVAAFFSGGVDSWSTLIDHPEITDLVFVRGFDLMPGIERHRQVAPLVEDRMRWVASEMGLELHVVETNLRELSDPLIPWEAYFNCANAAVAHFLAPRFERILLASGLDHEVDDPVASAQLIDHLWSSERMEMIDDGGRYSRVERTARIANHPLAQQTLRVCWENRDAAYNCGECRKCLMTMVTLEALGELDSVTTFSRKLDLTALERIEINQIVLLTLWEDVLDAVREARRADLEPAVERVVATGRSNLGLSPDYRRRSRPGPLPLQGPHLKPTEAEPSMEELLSSRSWRMTRPLRHAAAVVRQARDRLPRLTRSRP